MTLPRRVVQHLVDGFPSLMVALWATAFAIGGTSLPIALEAGWRWAAGVVVLVNLVATVRPYCEVPRLVAGVATLAWLMVWTGYLAAMFIHGDNVLAQRLSVWGISQFLLLAVFVAWSYGRQPMRQVKEELEATAATRAYER